MPKTSSDVVKYRGKGSEKNNWKFLLIFLAKNHGHPDIVSSHMR